MNLKMGTRVFAGIAVAALCSGLAGCGQEQPASTYNFESKVATRLEEDGWLYYCYFEGMKEGIEESEDSDRSQPDSPYYVEFGAYNFKHTTLPDYMVPVVDEKNRVVDFVEPPIPYLHLNQALKPELETLNNWLTKRGKPAPIATEDLKPLELKTLDEELVVSLYNDMAVGDSLPAGRFGYLPETGFPNEADDLPADGSPWQVGYYVPHGVLTYVRIDRLLPDGTLLSDAVEKGTATYEQKALYGRVQKIENTIRQKGRFKLTDEEKAEVGDEDALGRLYAITDPLDDPEKNK